MKKPLATLLALTIGMIILTGITASVTYAEDGENSVSEYVSKPIPKPNFLPGPSEDTQTSQGTRNILANKVLPTLAIMMIGTVGMVSIVFIIIGGVRFTVAYGNEEAVESAKKQIIWSIAGFIIALLSYTIVSIIINLKFEQNPQDQQEAQCQNAYGMSCAEYEASQKSKK